MTMLEVRGLATHFVTRAGVARAVQDVAFTLEKGRILGLVGESGSGKSVTAFSLMNLVDPPGRIVAGEVLFDGEDLRRATPARWNEIRGNRISMIFQDPMMSLNPVMRIGAQLAETVLVHRRMPAAKAREIALDALRRVGIPAPQERLLAYPHELSGGMRQRVAIANALVNTPDLIIADEPTTALDVTIQAQILYEVKRVARASGTALIWITHDLGVIKDLADEVCVMYAGRIVERGPVAQVIAAPRHPYTRGLVDSLPRQSSRGTRLHAIPGTVPPLLALPPGCTFAPRCGRRSADCERAVPEARREGAREVRCLHPMETP
jgi:peptide/nickel transport system ATP-binding protein